MDILGFSLNLVSLLAITLSTGILVDDAIVEIENIVRHMRMGKSPYQAAIDAADEIGLAVIAISLTIVAIFTPASFMPGIAGQFFKQFGITVSVQVLFSLLAARFVTPMLAAYFLRHHTIEEKPPGAALRAYTRLVTWSVKHYPRHRVIGLVLFAASVWSIGLLLEGIPARRGHAQSRMAIELPPGSQLSDTERVDRGDRPRLLRRARRSRASSSMAGGSRRRRGVRRASIYINYTPKARTLDHAARSSSSRSAASSTTFPTCATGSSTRTACAPSPSIVTGPDNDGGRRTSPTNSPPRCAAIPLVADVISETGLDRPELLHPAAHRPAGAAQCRPQTGLAETIRVATMGDIGPALARFDTGDRRCRSGSSSTRARPHQPSGDRTAARADGDRRRRSARRRGRYIA